MDKKFLEKYADLILDTGINMEEGRCIRIICEPIHWDFVNLLTERAYIKGARFVKTELDHPMASINRANHSNKKYLDYLPPYHKEVINTMIDEKWSLIRFDGKSEPEIFKKMNQDTNAVITKTANEAGKPLMKSILSGNNTWTIAALPTPEWANQILGTGANEASVEELWKIITKIMRLDHDDPAKAWSEHADILAKRSKYLTSNNFDYFHFIAPDTDLKVYMNQGSIWNGGTMTSSEGNKFFPNLPTEEVYTTPDLSKTTGTAKVTRPVAVLGDQVEEAWFEFANGEVINYGAKYGKHLLDKYFEIDPKAKRLGEIALVDAKSPIFQANKIFHSILFDENAACHMALGRGIASSIEGGTAMTDDQLEEAGCNTSILHTDFMIGSEKMDVIGYKKDGSFEQIIKSGSFIIN